MKYFAIYTNNNERHTYIVINILIVFINNSFYASPERKKRNQIFL